MLDPVSDGRTLYARHIFFARIAPALLQLNFAPERVARILARQYDALRKRPETKAHL